MSSSSTDDDERLLRERRPTGANTDELLDLLERTRDSRRNWIQQTKPTITAIIQRYPRFLDLNSSVSINILFDLWILLLC